MSRAAILRASWTTAIGDAIIARATVVYGGKSQAVCRCDVFVVKDGREAMCATAQGTITRIGTASP